MEKALVMLWTADPKNVRNARHHALYATYKITESQIGKVIDIAKADANKMGVPVILTLGLQRRIFMPNVKK